jgi:hypothetical protein
MSTNLHLIIKPCGMARIMQRKNWNSNTKDDFEDYEIKIGELEKILKKLKTGKDSVEDNVLSEVYKYQSENFKISLFSKF